MANKSFFLRASKVVNENKKSYAEKAAETKQHSARLAEMQQYVDVSEEKRALLLDLIKNGKCPDNPEESMLHRGIVVYVKFLKVIDIIDNDLTQANINHVIITGQVSQDKRGEIARNFKEDPTNTVILISNCASESISLHGTNLLVLYNCPGSHGAATQLFGRVLRYGSRFKEAYVNYIICDETADEYFPILLSSKKELEEEILHSDYIDMKKDIKSFDSEILKRIRKEMLWKTKKRKTK